MALTAHANLRVTTEWIEAPGVVAPELAATWCSLAVRIGDHVVTQVVDDRARSVRDSIEVPTYPLARWIARNWFFLHHHSRPLQLPSPLRRFAGRASRSPELSDWMLHHNLRAVGEGFVWPDLVMLADRSNAQGEWWADAQARVGAQVRYLTNGASSISLDSYSAALHQVVESTVARLEDQGVDDHGLADEWNELLELDPEERDFCATAARLGLDGFDLSDEVADLVIRVAEELEPSLLDDFLEAAQPSLLAEDLSWVAQSSAAIEHNRSSPEQLPTIRRAGSDLPPPKRGLTEARRLRKRLGLQPTDDVNPMRWLSVTNQPNEDSNLIGLLGRSPSDSPVLATNGRQTLSVAKRFSAARALRDIAVRSPGRLLVTSSHQPEQKTSRAFAAEFLAPVDGIRQFAPNGNGAVPWDAVAEAADHYGVDPQVIQHQVLDGLGRYVLSNNS